MKERAPHSPMAGTGWLQGWRLTFGGEDFAWEGALSTVVEEEGEQVFVVLYDVPDHDSTRLDRWEGGELGLHKKLRLRVHTLEGDVLAWIYVLDAYEGGEPSARYLGVIADAAELDPNPGGSDERLGGDAVVEHTGTAHAVAFDDRDVTAVLGRHERRLVACRAAAHDHDAGHRT